MSGMINELINVMTDQITCYEYLLGLADEKTDVLVKNDIEGLKKITELENRVVSKNITLEKKRLSVIEDVSYILNFDYETTTISGILVSIKGNEGYDELRKVTLDMKDVIENLKEKNDHNKMLIENSLEYVDFTMNAIQSSFGDEALLSESTNGSYMEASTPFFDKKQ